jgi:hypothetical protein
MADGGLNCDAEAYLVANEVASSMVGTVAPIEAMLALCKRHARAEDLEFLDRAAASLMCRALTRGSQTVHNAEERARETEWLLPTFPRLYFYDVLRGLSALSAWAETFRRPLPLRAVSGVTESLIDRFPDGRIRVGRRAFDGWSNRIRSASGVWQPAGPASTFALLEADGRIGEVSVPLTRQWHAARARLLALGELGLIVRD